MRTLLALVAVLGLVGCGETPPGPVLRTPEARVFVPDDRFFRCPVVSDFPNPTTLTDGQIAELMVTLDTNNRICHRSITEIRRQLLAAKETIENE